MAPDTHPPKSHGPIGNEKWFHHISKYRTYPPTRIDRPVDLSQLISMVDADSPMVIHLKIRRSARGQEAACSSAGPTALREAPLSARVTGPP